MAQTIIQEENYLKINVMILRGEEFICSNCQISIFILVDKTKRSKINVK